MSATTTPTFSAQILGQTEKALNAILARELAEPGLTEYQWIALTLSVTAGGTVDNDELVGRLAGALKRGEADARSHIDALAAAGLVRVSAADGAPATVEVSDAGQALHGRIRAAVADITQRLWGDLRAEELAVSGRVLSTVLERANAELAGV
jgi:DNA-binding MarR family transcriptional regulator